MKRYLEAKQGHPAPKDDINDELFDEAQTDPEVPLSVTAPHRAYPEMGPDFTVHPLDQESNRLDGLHFSVKAVNPRNDEPELERFEPTFSPIDPKRSDALPTAAKVIGALIAIALIGLVALGGWTFGTASDQPATQVVQTEKANKRE